MNFIERSEKILRKSVLLLLVMAVPGLAWAGHQDTKKTSAPAANGSATAPKPSASAAKPSAPAHTSAPTTQHPAQAQHPTAAQHPTTTEHPIPTQHPIPTHGHPIPPVRKPPVNQVVLKDGTKAQIRNGQIRSIDRNGMHIERNPRGVRTVATRLPNGARVVGYGGGRGFVERPFRGRGGRVFVRRTYWGPRSSYARVYGSYRWHGAYYGYYVRPFFYAPAFYGWAYHPWGARVYWGIGDWGWGATPWFYGGYFAPSLYYASPAYWLTDYLIAANLQAAYAAQAGANAPAPASAAGATIEIPGNQAWVDTGIGVQPGDTVTISASGAVSMGGGWAPGPPAGLPRSCDGLGFPAPNARCWSLIGRVGENGPSFYVGSGRSLRAPAGGELYLGVNDNILGDNTGSWTAVISSPATAAPQPDALPAPAPGQDAALSPETKKVIAEEVQRQLQAEQAAAANQQLMGADPAGAPGALDPNERVFVVSSALNETTGGQECGLSAGDIVTRLSYTPDPNQNVNVSVLSSKSGDCRAGLQLAVAVQDLQDMHNHFQEQLDAGMDELKNNQGKKGMPAAPGANVAPTNVADGQAQPDADAQALLQQQQQQADQTEQQVTQEVSAVMVQPVSLPERQTNESSSVTTGAAIAQAIIRRDATSLRLPPGQLYLYGMVTGGAAPSSQFVAGQYQKAVNPAGQLAAALAYGTNDQNSYTTETGYHVVGGVSIAGSWDNFSAFHSSNSQSGARFASVNFTVPDDSLVIVIALASSQQAIKLQGLPNLQIDAVSSGAGTEAMTIAHASLPPGAYSVTEMSSATVAGQDPEHMADLVGVFVLGSKGQPSQAIRKSPPTRPRITSTGSTTLDLSQTNGVPAVTSEQQCTGGGDTEITNNTHGTIQIVSGTGAFARVTSQSKLVRVSAGAALQGSVTLHVLNQGPGFAIAPLVQTRSWDDPQTSWKQIAVLRPGEATITAQVNQRAPLDGGTYHDLFAFQLEKSGGNVASGTNWPRGQDVWNDGNDVAQFDSSQILQAQKFGCVVDSWLTQEGPRLLYVPADAITIEVTPSSVSRSVSPRSDNTSSVPTSLPLSALE